ncbi:MAG TPA: beta-1,6-N-acetylglucosaminyltransferase [Flavisolibacter sp.]|nr:beta-1,6-N-acetylglucosaminyltransferase [Flavisolibacter sp.]
MKKAYIILVHKNPDQACRLIQRLDDGSSSFFIHIDEKAALPPFQKIFDLGDKVTKVKRVHAKWGELSLVEAIVNGLVAVRKKGVDFERIILLSGQDYPIKSNRYIDNYFRTSPHKIFMEYFGLPNHAKWQPNGGLYRVNKYFIGLKPIQLYTAKALNFLALILPHARRKIPSGMKPYAGSMWWIIDMAALNYILHYLQRNPGYIAFHRHTFAPDEVFFQMLLLNAGDPRIKQNITPNNLHFIKWKDIDAAHPETFKTKDINEIITSKALFARKFDPSKDAGILDLVDRHCLDESIIRNQ